MKKVVFEFFSRWFGNLFNRCNGVTADNFDTIYTPTSAEYLQEIEENEKCAVACNDCTAEADFIAAMEFSTTARNRGIPNVMPEELRQNALALLHNILTPLMKATGWTYTINSGFRSDELNTAVGGARTSQHRTGEAVDIRCYDVNGRRVPVLEVARMAKKHLQYDQQILYGTFNHLSYRKNGNNRGQIIYHSSYNGERL